MSFAEVMLRVLPPVNGQQPHITGHYGEQRPSGPHGGTDFNYIGGQNGINLQYPKVYAPIAGVVTFTGGSYGTIKIKDAEGNSHEILHTSSHIVSVGATVAAGDEIGAMGGQGPNGAAQYPRHVHYQMKGPTGTLISPETWWNQQTTAPASAPPVSEPGVASTSAFQFPIRKTGGTQFKDADELFAALELETSGHYLLGNHKFWHGGIHISNKSAPQCVRDEPVRCIGDGVVVAYRLNKDYLTSTFEGASDSEALKYSNSFCLVRHEYKSPANTEVTPNTHNELTLYSLYMHLLPFDRYPAPPEEIPTPRIKMVAGGFKARSYIKDAVGCIEYGGISSGTEIEILEEHVDGIHAKGKLLKGTVVGRVDGQEFWFAYKKDGVAYPKTGGGASWITVLLPERTKPGYWQGKVKAVVTGTGLTLRKPPATLAHGAPAGDPMGTGLVLCTNSTIEFDSGKVFNLKVGSQTLRMAECTFIPSTSGPATGLKNQTLSVPPNFWACVEDIAPNRFVDWRELTPTAFDKVVPLGTAIKAGDPIGYLGMNETLQSPTGGVAGKYQVHLEVFSADPRIEDFLKNTAGIKQGKQYIHLPAATVLSKKPPEIGTFELVKEHVVELGKAVPFTDTFEWYELTVVDNGETKNGLLKKSEVTLLTQHDWEKLGFRVIKESNPSSDGFLDPEDMPDFFKDLYSELDELGDGDGKVTPQDFPKALKNVELRDHWSKLIAYHPTEWKDKADTPKWARLAQLLEGSPEVLEHEQARINSLVFWDDPALQTKQLGSGLIWHFHPVAFVGNAISSRGKIKITVAMLKKVFEGLKKTAEKDDLLAEVASQINENSEKYKLDTVLRLSHFFAQVRQEIGSKCTVEEDFTYGVEGLKSTFGYFASHPGEATTYGYPGPTKYVSPQNQIAIANRAYASRLGNGNVASGMGWKYRGRGLKHLTGKANYEAFKTYHKTFWGEEVDFVGSPDLLHTKYQYSVRSGVYFWLKNSIFAEADKGDTRENVDAVTKIINRDTDSYLKRWNNFERIYKVEKIFEGI
ncbi:peptidoglycan DD-metalloendopeptidase family protein [Pseudomonas sp. H3_D04]